MIPVQYLISSNDLDAAISTGCRWIQVTDTATDDMLEICHNAGCYFVLTDDVEQCRILAADGVVLTQKGIHNIALKEPEPSGIVLQKPLPVTTAVAAARRILGEDSPQMIGVLVESAADAIAAAKAGADFLQAEVSVSVELTKSVRERCFTTPIVALGVGDIQQICPLLDKGVSGIACTISDVPPILIPSFLSADEI